MILKPTTATTSSTTTKATTDKTAAREQCDVGMVKPDSQKKPPEKTDRNAASLLAAYNDLIGSGYSAYQSRIRDIQIAETPVDERITAPNPEALYETVRQKIAEFGLPASTRIIEKEYAPQSWQEMNRSFDRYHNLRSRFSN